MSNSKSRVDSTIKDLSQRLQFAEAIQIATRLYQQRKSIIRLKARVQAIIDSARRACRESLINSDQLSALYQIAIQVCKECGLQELAGKLIRYQPEVGWIPEEPQPSLYPVPVHGATTGGMRSSG